MPPAPVPESAGVPAPAVVDGSGSTGGAGSTGGVGTTGGAGSTGGAGAGAVGGLLAGSFELLEEIGSGAAGTVYRARTRRPLRDVPAGATVAVKFVRQDLLADARARQQLDVEATLGQRVQSPHVVRILGAETVELMGLELSYLVMELVEGRTLRRFLQENGPAVEDLARRIGQDAALGLHALHRLDIVHRDVKPENLVLTPAGDVKVMDLGLARVETGAGDAGTGSWRGGDRRLAAGESDGGGFFGNLAYAAPEVLRGQPASARSDLYALGCVLFEVVTGVHPFAAHSGDVDELLHAHLEVEPPRASHLQPRTSAFLERVVQMLLAKDPEERPRSAKELADLLAAGEASSWWRQWEQEAPTLASRRRLRALRRFAPTPFAGRRAEQRVLDRWLERARSGRGVAVCLRGPEGMGRRRLVDECVDRWLREHDDVVFFGGEAEPSTTGHLGEPFPRLLLDWFLHGDVATSERLQERLQARIREGAHGGAGLTDVEAQRLAACISGSDPGGSPQVRADLLARGVLQIAQSRCLVLRIDRAERLDTTARLVVSRLADGIDGERVLLITIAGPEAEPFAGRTLQLEGLDETAFVQLGVDLFAEGQAPQELLREAHGALGGSPGNLIDALEELAQQGRLHGLPGGYRDLTSDVQDLRPAGTLLARLRQRVQRLPAERAHVLQAAAVLGDRFPVPDLVSLTGRSELDVLQTLSMFQGRVVRAQGGTVSFRHRDYRAALLDMMPKGSRRRLHRLAAWVLEDRGAPAVEVGLHLSRAMEHAACVPPLLEGLRQLTQAGSRRASLRLADRVRFHLDALAKEAAAQAREATAAQPAPTEPAPTERAATQPSPAEPPPAEQRQLAAWRLEFLELNGQAWVHAELPEKAHAAFRRAYDLALRLDDAEAMARCLIALANLTMASGRFLSALGHLDRVGEILAGIGEQRGLGLLARALGLTSRIMGYLGETDEALHLVQEALRCTAPEHDAMRAHLLVDLARLEFLRNHFVAALKNLDRAGELFEGVDDPTGRMRVHLHRGHALTAIGDRDGGRRELDRALEAARRLSNLRVQGRALLCLAEDALLHGEHELARAHLLDAVTTAGACGDRVTRCAAALHLRQLGGTMKIAGLDDLVIELGVPALRVQWLLVQADEARAGGRTAEANACIDEAAEIDRRTTIPLYLHLAVLRRSGQDTRAERLIEEVAARLPAGPMRRRFTALA